jgi:hypothetical protein
LVVAVVVDDVDEPCLGFRFQEHLGRTAAGIFVPGPFVDCLKNWIENHFKTKKKSKNDFLTFAIKSCNL